MVWEILKSIPYGTTITYGDITKLIAKNTIIIPCHRVVGAKGNLTGYSGRIDKKIKLLEIKNVNIQDFYKPKKER